MTIEYRQVMVAGQSVMMPVSIDPATGKPYPVGSAEYYAAEWLTDLPGFQPSGDAGLTPTDITFTVRITNAGILDRRALEGSVPSYSCASTTAEPCLIGTEWVEEIPGDPFQIPLFWNSSDYAEYVAHMKSVHPGARIEKERVASGQWMPQVPDVVGGSFIRPDNYLTIEQTARFTVPARGGGPGGGGYWNPEYPWIRLGITGGPINGRTYGPLGGGTVKLHPGCQVTFDYASKALTVNGANGPSPEPGPELPPGPGPEPPLKEAKMNWGLAVLGFFVVLVIATRDGGKKRGR